MFRHQVDFIIHRHFNLFSMHLWATRKHGTCGDQRGEIISMRQDASLARFPIKEWKGVRVAAIKESPKAWNQVELYRVLRHEATHCDISSNSISRSSTAIFGLW